MRETPLLDETVTRLIQRGVFINVVVETIDGMTVMSRALGCRITDDRCKVVVFVAANYFCAQLARVREVGAVSVAFAMPFQDHSIEIKGREVRFVSPQIEDLVLIENYRKALAATVVSLGMREWIARSVVPEVYADIVAISFTPTAVAVG